MDSNMLKRKDSEKWLSSVIYNRCYHVVSWKEYNGNDGTNIIYIFGLPHERGITKVEDWGRDIGCHGLFAHFVDAPCLSQQIDHPHHLSGEIDHT
jgi:hypothetical protein